MKTFKQFNEGLVGAGLKALGKTIGKTKLIDIAKFGGAAFLTKKVADFLGRKKGNNTNTNTNTKTNTPNVTVDKDKKSDKEDLFKKGVEVIKKAKENPGTGVNPNTRKAFEIMKKEGF